MKTVWNTAGGCTSRSDRVDFLVTRPEVTADFCFSQKADSTPDGDMASIVARIVMNPHMAKRLAGMLGQAIREHEGLFGSIDEQAMAGGELLRSLVRDLCVPHGYEYSFKMCEGLVLGDRFLITMDRAALGKDFHQKVIELCTVLRAPDSFLKAIDRSVSQARILHFGFEASAKGSMHKIYLEFPLSATTEPALLHTSYKWDPLHRERQAIGRYVRYPLLSYKETAERLGSLLAVCRRPGAFEMADEFLQLAMPRLQGSFHYLEVTEEGNPRKSFDVNFYSAFLRMGDIRPLLLRMAERYSLSIGEFGTFLESVANKRFGHLAGGVDREGRDFFSIHFGIEPRRR
jgi:hypothetical protein